MTPAIAMKAISIMAVFSPYLPRLPNTAYLTVWKEISPSMINMTSPAAINMYDDVARSRMKIHIMIPAARVSIPASASA